MDQTRKARLEAGGIMVDEALERFMGNEAMLERYLQKFLSEKSYAMLRDSLASNDWEAAGRAAHTLKSICGTIGCEAMQELVILQERHIRAGEWKEAVGMMPEISKQLREYLRCDPGVAYRVLNRRTYKGILRMLYIYIILGN